MLPDAAPPVEIRTFVPSSKYLYVTRQGALQQNKQIHIQIIELQQASWRTR